MKVLLLLAMLACVAAFSPRGAHPAPIGFIGDSITANDPAGKSPADIAALLLHTTAVNQAVGGTRTDSWLPYGALYQHAVRAFHAANVQIVQVLLGTNDASWYIPTSRYAANLTQIVVALRRAGLHVVVAEPPFLLPGSLYDAWHYTHTMALLRAYRAADDAIARDTGSRLGETGAFAYFQSHPRQLFDGKHPGPAGVIALGHLFAAGLS